MVKFLVVRFSSIGDIVLTSPLIRCLKKQVEGAEIYYLTKSKFVCLLEANPYITKTFTLKNSYKELVKELKQENIDYIIDLHKNIRTLRIKNSVRRMSYSFDKLNVRKWIFVNFKKNLLPDQHIVDRYLKTTRVFSVENDGVGLDYFIPEKDEVNSGELIAKLKTPFICLVVGGGHSTKQIPLEKLKYLCQGIKRDIVLLGGKEDIEKADRIIGELEKSNLHNLTGKLSIHQSASVLKQSGLVITPDTGLMHIAAAFKKNVISVWGNTVPEFGMYPYGAGSKSEIFEVKGLKCRPCSKIGFNDCPKKHFRCMQEQAYDEIIEKANFF